jgi:hypothetical protein
MLNSASFDERQQLENQLEKARQDRAEQKIHLQNKNAQRKAYMEHLNQKVSNLRNETMFGLSANGFQRSQTLQPQPQISTLRCSEYSREQEENIKTNLVQSDQNRYQQENPSNISFSMQVNQPTLLIGEPLQSKNYPMINPYITILIVEQLKNQLQDELKAGAIEQDNLINESNRIEEMIIILEKMQTQLIEISLSLQDLGRCIDKQNNKPKHAIQPTNYCEFSLFTTDDPVLPSHPFFSTDAQPDYLASENYSFKDEYSVYSDLSGKFLSL